MTESTSLTELLKPALQTEPVVRVPQTAHPAQVDEDGQWHEVILHPAIVLIIGKRGSGKSALAYRLLELFRHRLRPYLVGVPAQAQKLLPEWIGLAPTLEELPPKAIALVDEAYLQYHARRSMAEESTLMSQILNLSRQREQSLIFVSQESRQLDRNVASSANVIVFKELGMLQLEFERKEVKKIAEQAQRAFATVQGNRQRWAYVYSPDADFIGMLKNQLPTLWKPSLSRLFASGQAPTSFRKAERLGPEQKAARAQDLRAKGYSYSQIAKELGVSKSSVVNYLKGYPYC